MKLKPSFILTNALILAGSFFQNAPAAVAQNADISKAPTFDPNRASLASIESTWLKIPNSCKAKGFNAEPVAIEHAALSSAVAAVYLT